MLVRPSLKFIQLSYVVVLILAAAIGVYLMTAQGDPRLVWLLLLPGLILFFTVIRHLRRRLVKLTVMGDRLRYESGLFSKTTRTIELAKVQDVRVDQSLGQRMADIGDLSLETAGGTSRIEMDSIDRPQDVADRILELARAQQKPSHE
jgi:membrane protein YdbS with pleckstrin-like domain